LTKAQKLKEKATRGGSIFYISYMPTLSLFFGIIVRMYNAEYSGEEVVIALDGEILEGKLPVPKMKLLEAWMEIHKEDLSANWNLLNKGEPFFKIEPLK
jgi:hypothetical protein